MDEKKSLEKTDDREQRKQGGLGSGAEHPIVDLQHEQRSGEHQKVDADGKQPDSPEQVTRFSASVAQLPLSDAAVFTHVAVLSGFRDICGVGQALPRNRAHSVETMSQAHNTWRVNIGLSSVSYYLGIYLMTAMACHVPNRKSVHDASSPNPVHAVDRRPLPRCAGGMRRRKQSPNIVKVGTPPKLYSDTRFGVVLQMRRLGFFQ